MSPSPSVATGPPIVATIAPLLLGVFACAPTPAAETNTATSASTSTETSPVTDSSGDASTGYTFECDALDRPPTPKLAVTIHNTSAEVRYVEVAAVDPELGPDFFTKRPYDVISDDDEGAPLNAQGLCFGYRECTLNFWCPWTFSGPGQDPCDPEPFRPGPVRIEPGSTYQADPWDGYAWGPGVLPYECQNQLCGVPLEDTECMRASAVAGPLTVRVRYGAAISCVDEGDDSCDCEPYLGRPCVAHGALVPSPEIAAIELDFPATEAVTIDLP